MTPQQFIAVIVRFASIYLVFSALMAIQLAFSIATDFGNQSFLAVELLVGTYLVLAIIFWSFPMSIAHFLIPNTKFDNVIKLQPYQAIYVACVCLGLWICVIKALPYFSTYISIGTMVLHNNQSLRAVDLIENRKLLEGFIQLIAGLLLIFKASYLSKKIISLQDKTDI